MTDQLIKPGEIAYHLELTAAQMKIVHTALKSLFDDLGREEREVKDVVASVLAKLPGEYDRIGRFTQLPNVCAGSARVPAEDYFRRNARGAKPHSTDRHSPGHGLAPRGGLDA